MMSCIPSGCTIVGRPGAEADVLAFFLDACRPSPDVAECGGELVRPRQDRLRALSALCVATFRISNRRYTYRKVASFSSIGLIVPTRFHHEAFAQSRCQDSTPKSDTATFLVNKGDATKYWKYQSMDK